MNSVEIDPSSLPSRALLDTGIVLRAFGDRDDHDAYTASAFVDAMLKARNEILISAVGLAEVLRGRTTRVPRVRGITVVGFDERAAIILGERLPQTVLRETSSKSGDSLQYLKYDALIVATALRYKADVLVSLDAKMHKLATHVGLRCARPSEFELVTKQTSFAILRGGKTE